MKFLFAVALFALTGCASNSYFVLKNHHFDTPEAKGKNFQFSASVVPYQDVTTVQTTFNASGPIGTQVTVNNKDLTNDAVETIDHSSILLSLGLVERLDLSLDFAIGNQPNYLNVKYQFVGDTRADADSGNFSVSGVLGLGYIAVNEDNPDGYTNLDDFEVAGHAARLGVVMGMRSTKELLLYWSNSYENFNTKTDYVTVSNQGDFKINGNRFMSMLGAEYTFEEKISVGIEYGYVYSDVQRADNEGFTSFAGRVGYHF